jgi:hypothetical protein
VVGNKIFILIFGNLFLESCVLNKSNEEKVCVSFAYDNIHKTAKFRVNEAKLIQNKNSNSRVMQYKIFKNTSS